MAETVQMNLNVLGVTKERVAQIAELTHRGKGDVLDLAVEKLWFDLTRGVSIETLPAVIGQDERAVAD